MTRISDVTPEIMRRIRRIHKDSTAVLEIVDGMLDEQLAGADAGSESNELRWLCNVFMDLSFIVYGSTKFLNHTLVHEIDAMSKRGDCAPGEIQSMVDQYLETVKAFDEDSKELKKNMLPILQKDEFFDFYDYDPGANPKTAPDVSN